MTQTLAEILKPIDREADGAGRRTAIDVYDVLQSYILDGTLKPGTIISQVAIADALQVSRTPVREAMRMLQADCSPASPITAAGSLSSTLSTSMRSTPNGSCSKPWALR